MIAFILLAAVSAWLVTRRAPQHRPIAWALTICAVLDAVRLLPLPARAGMALCLLCPGVSAWAMYAAFSPRSAVYMAGAITAFWTPWATGVLTAENAAMWWHVPLPFLYTISCIVGGVSALYMRASTVTQRVALILLAGDALAVASLCAREWISDQAGVVLGLVTVYQVAWYWRWERGLRFVD